MHRRRHKGRAVAATAGEVFANVHFPMHLAHDARGAAARQQARFAAALLDAVSLRDPASKVHDDEAAGDASEEVIDAQRTTAHEWIHALRAPLEELIQVAQVAVTAPELFAANFHVFRTTAKSLGPLLRALDNLLRHDRHDNAGLGRVARLHGVLRLPGLWLRLVVVWHDDDSIESLDASRSNNR